MLEFGKPINFKNQFPPLLTKRLVITNAQVLNLFSTPVTLFPATPGVGFIVERGWLYKEPGTAYTIGGAGNYSITAGALTLFGPNPPTGVFDSPLGRTVLLQGWGGTGVYPNLVLETQFVNVAITLQQATANMTAGTSNLFCYFEFRAYQPALFIWD